MRKLIPKDPKNLDGALVWVDTDISKKGKED